MGAFLLISSGKREYDTGTATGVISRQCLSEPRVFDFPGWRLYLFPKAMSHTENFITDGKNSLFVTGTPFIHGCNYRETLWKTLEHLSKGGDFLPDIRGIYFILYSDGTRLRFFTDRLGLYSIYHSDDGMVISSSFLGLSRGMTQPQLNRMAAVENLLTGTVTGRDTIFEGISRFIVSQPGRFNDLEFVPSRQELLLPGNRKHKTGNIMDQAALLDNWFEGLLPMASEHGVDSGITGGLDSRLILALCRKHFRSASLQFHSHLRQHADIDFTCGRDICRGLGLEFVEAPVRDAEEMSDSELAARMDEGMYFNDGQVRTHSFWHEEYNTASYRRGILNGKLLGLNGIGGEQYRNMERHLLSFIRPEKWIRFELVEKYSGTRTASPGTIKEVSRRLSSTISGITGTPERKRVNLLYIKRYLNEVYNPANRVLRACNENRLTFFLSPLADPVLSEEAYNAIGHLGISLGYEARLINFIDPEAAAFSSAYGFSFNRKEPLRSILPPLLFNTLIPGFLKGRIYNLVKKGETDRWVNMSEKSSYLTDCIETVRRENLPLNTAALLRRRDTGPLLFAMGHLLLSVRKNMDRNEL